MSSRPPGARGGFRSWIKLIVGDIPYVCIMSEEQIHNAIIEYLMGYKPERIGLFGSFARGDHRESSDIDILVRFEETCTLFQLIRIENELSELIGRKVDLVTEGAIKNERIKDSIQQDLRVIFEA